MDKLKAAKIFLDSRKFVSDKIENASVQRLVMETKQKQHEVLKLKEVNQDNLKLIVQL